ncbi:MAG TPA: rhodanese-like domain-containing protein [Thermoanaerobaculia bacterium]|nr:rhodanese-like domain-containing protein [Thermoanaerobaculia bacterium]
MLRRPRTVLLLILLGLSLPLAGQSPLQWPLPKPAPPPAVFPEILVSPRGVTGTLDQPGAVALDVRSPEDFTAGHLPGAVSAWRPGEEGNGEIDRVRSLLAARGITGTGPVVLYGGRDDARVLGRFFWLLEAAGCRDVKVLDGGIAAWTAAGGKLEAGPSPGREAGFHEAARDTASAAPDWVARSFDQPGVVLLDLRDPRGWERWEAPPSWAAGHVPHALPFDVRGLLPQDGGWPDPAEIRRRAGDIGPRAGDSVGATSSFVLYGEDAADPLPGLGYLLFRMAGLDVRVFPGGWRAWTAGPGRPVVRIVDTEEIRRLLEAENPGLAQDRPPTRLILLDLRTSRDFQLDHLPGARSLPLHLFDRDFERIVAEGWPGAARATIPLIFYCYGRDCVRSRDAGTRAARLGFRNILWYRGGTADWAKAGLPLVEAPP